MKASRTYTPHTGHRSELSLEDQQTWETDRYVGQRAKFKSPGGIKGLSTENGGRNSQGKEGNHAKLHP